MIYFIIHGQCFDGFIAGFSAWIKYRQNPNIKFISVGYNQPFPISDADLIGSEVYIMDFSYSKEILLHVQSLVKKIQVLDHHTTAEKQLQDLDFALFDMNKSGAMLAWEYFNPEKSIPKIVQYVQDRDLWKFELPDSKEINAVIQSNQIGKEEDFITFEKLTVRLDDNNEFKKMVEEGTAILRFQDQYVQLAIKRGLKFVTLDGHSIPAVNTSIFESEICNTLLKLYPNHPFSATYYDQINSDLQAWSLRGRGDFDVSSVALKFNGGGHFSAAGFKKKRD